MVVLVYLVAGMSSRFGGNVKQMALVGPEGETLIEYSVKQALQNKFNKIIFITNKKTEHLFKNIFGNNYKGTDILYVEQVYDINLRDRPWGTTDAICSINGLIDEPFIMINGDDLYGEKTFEKGFELMCGSGNLNFIGSIKMDKLIPSDGKSVNRGVIFVENENVVSMKEMLNINISSNPELLKEYGNVNFICMQPNVLDKLQCILEKFKSENENSRSIECLLPDSLDILIKNRQINMKYFEITEDILGITHPGDDIKVAEIIRSK